MPSSRARDRGTNAGGFLIPAVRVGRCLLLALLFLGAAPAASAQPATLQAPGAGDIRVRGDYLELNNEQKVVVIKGSAYIEFGEMKLWAENIQGHLERHEVYAQGNVRFWRADEKLEGHFLVYNYKTRRGRIHELRTKRGVDWIKAERLEIEPYEMRGYNVYATTCDHPPPHYYLKAERMTLYPRDRMVLERVALVAGGTVRMRFPSYSIDMKGEGARSANRLYVSPSWSAGKGFGLKTAYSFYFSPKAYGRAWYHPSQSGDDRAGFEFKYQPSSTSSGKFDASAHRAKTILQDETRLHLTHQEKLAGNATVGLDVTNTSIDHYGLGTDEELNLNLTVQKPLGEWDLGLSYSRRVDPDGDAYVLDNAVQSLDLTPRLTFKQRQARPFLGSSMGWRIEGSMERVKEVSTLGTVEATKEDLQFFFTPKPLDVAGLSKWTWNFRDQVTNYSTDDFRHVVGLNVNTLERYGPHLSTSFAYSVQRTNSTSAPFHTYDVLTDQNNGTWYLRLDMPQRFTSTLFQTSYDFERGLFTGASSNFVYRSHTDDPLIWSSGLTLGYDLGPNPESLDDLTLRTVSTNWRLERKDAWRHSLITNYDMLTRRLTSISSSHDLLLTRRLKLSTSANWAYDATAGGLDLTRLNFALVQDLHCWEGRLRWDVEQREAFLEFYLKSASRKKLSLGVDYESGFELDAQVVDGERPGSIWSSY